MDNLAGKFITFEGVEGAGKSTIINFVKEHIDAVVTREPGGTDLGDEIRDMLLSHKNDDLTGDVELLLLFAARKHHLDTVIMPAIAANLCVLCDRFTDSTYAYQGAGRGVDIKHIETLENLVQGDFRPDLTFILDLPAEIGLNRIKSRGVMDRIEQQKVEFFTKVRQGYLERAKLDPTRYIVIEVEQPLEEVKSQVLDTLKNAFCK